MIKNGVINNSKGSYQADLLIENGKIKEIGENLYDEDCEIIDVKGKMILPGGVDVHTHMDLDLGKYKAVDDFYTGSLAAAFGGTTTIVDHIGFGPIGCPLDYQIHRYHELAKDQSIVDYSFHGVIQHINENILNEMETLSNQGITSFKVYMTYDYMLKDEEILQVLRKAKEIGAVIAVHAENHGAIQYLREFYGKAGKLAPIYHGITRPDTTEAEAINRMIYLSEIAGFPPLYFVHVSTKRGLDEIILARKRGVKNVYCETCTQYLTLTEECYKKENSEGLKYIMAPPLRKKEDVDALWKGIENNDIDVIATDHCPFLMSQKLDGKDDFRIAPGGVAGVEERVEVILTEGAKRGIPMGKLVQQLSTNPAKIYGLYPRKGTIHLGSDADIIIIDKNHKEIQSQNRHSNADYTVYEGVKVDYVVDTVIQRGKIIIENNELVANKGHGVFLKRKKAPYDRKGE